MAEENQEEDTVEDPMEEGDTKRKGIDIIDTNCLSMILSFLL